MPRMVQAAGAAMLVMLLAALFLGPSTIPSDEPQIPASSHSPENAASGPIRTPHAPEISFILEARRELGSVVEGSSLDTETDNDDFAESLEQLVRP